MIDQDLRQALLEQHNLMVEKNRYVTTKDLNVDKGYYRYSSGKLMQPGDIVLRISVLEPNDMDLYTPTWLRIDEIEEYARNYTLDNILGLSEFFQIDIPEIFVVPNKQ